MLKIPLLVSLGHHGGRRKVASLRPPFSTPLRSLGEPDPETPFLVPIEHAPPLFVRIREDKISLKIYPAPLVSRSAKWGGSHLGGSSWNRPQRPNPGHLRDCWGCLGRFLGRLGHRTTAIVSTRGVGKSLEFRPGAPGDFFQVDRNARE